MANSLWYPLSYPPDTAEQSAWLSEARWYDGVLVPIRGPRLSTLCLNTKAGSTFFKRLIGVALRPVVAGQCKCIHCALLPYAVPEASLFASTPIFVVVRHPVPRMLSAYLDGGILGQVQHTLNSSRALRYTPSEFGALVMAVTAAPRQRQLNPHFRLQTLQCGWRTVGKRARVLRIEERARWLPRMLDEWWGLPRTLLKLGPVRARTTADARVAEFYDADRLARVHQWAAPDLRAFGYKSFQIAVDAQHAALSNVLKSPPEEKLPGVG